MCEVHTQSRELCARVKVLNPHTLKKTTNKPAKNVIGSLVRQLRLSQVPPVSQDDLAGRLAALGVTVDRTAIVRIEKGERYALDYEVVAIARALRVPIERLFRRK